MNMVGTAEDGEFETPILLAPACPLAGQDLSETPFLTLTSRARRPTTIAYLHRNLSKGAIFFEDTVIHTKK